MHTQTRLGGGQSPANSQNPASANSILVADCGTVFTKVSLLGLVEGQYRLMARGEAPTTVTPPHEDITRGIIQAIREIEFITGHHFIFDSSDDSDGSDGSGGQIIFPEQPGGDGVDVFVATISAGGPLRLVILGGVSPQFEELTVQALSGLYAEMLVLPSPSYVANSAPTSIPVGAATGTAQGFPPTTGAEKQWTPERVALEWERQVERIRELQPQAAMIVGIVNNPADATPIQEACQLIINADQALNEQRNASASAGVTQNDLAHRPLAVLYATAPQFIEATRRMLNGYAEVVRLDPLVSQAQLASTSVAIAALYEREVIESIPGYDRVQSWSAAAPAATAISLSSLVRFLAQHYTMNVTAVDVGGTNTIVMLAGEQNEFLPLVNSGIGVGPGVGALLKQVGWQRIARWLPFTMTEDELRQYTLNQLLHPQAAPTSTRELQIAQAFAREAIILTLEGAKQSNISQFNADLILATGGVIAHAPKYGQVVLMLLDALQPRGVTSLVLDRTMLISQLGAVATVAPVAAVQVNENDAVTHRLGTCVIPFGGLPAGQVAVRVGLEYSNGRQVMVDVMTGSLEVIPLPVNEQALLTLYPAPSVDVGLGPGERARAAEEIDGGLLGLIIDARGRPLQLPSNESERQARLLQWMQSVGA
jgi:hypothetical protein